jgi:hypothetical protein
LFKLFKKSTFKIEEMFFFNYVPVFCYYPLHHTKKEKLAYVNKKSFILVVVFRILFLIVVVHQPSLVYLVES